MTVLELLNAAKQGDVQAITRILDYERLSVDSSNKNGLTPLHHACQNGHLAAARLLIGRRCNVNAVTLELASPLHVATMGGHAKIVQLLLDSGADVLARDINHYNVIHFAASCSMPAIANLVLGFAAELDRTKKSTIVDELLTGVNVNASVPLHLAAQQGSVDTAAAIFKYTKYMSPERVYEAINARDDRDQTPLYYAAHHGHEDVVDILLQHGADATADRSGITPAQVAKTRSIREKINTAGGVTVEEAGHPIDAPSAAAVHDGSRIMGTEQILGARPNVAWSHTDNTRPAGTRVLHREPVATSSPLETQNTLYRQAKDQNFTTTYDTAHMRKVRR